MANTVDISLNLQNCLQLNLKCKYLSYGQTSKNTVVEEGRPLNNLHRHILPYFPDKIPKCISRGHFYFSSKLSY